MSLARRVLPQAPSRRGWCPSLARPMPTGDGLLARVHPPLGVLTPAQARAVAEGARRYGNGHIDVTARANLQIRGVTEATREALVILLAAAGLDDTRTDGGPQRLTLTPPLAGPEVVALAERIETVGLGILGLPAKTLVTIEDIGSVSDAGRPAGLSETDADIRLLRSPSASAPCVRERAAGVGGTCSIALALAGPDGPEWLACTTTEEAVVVVATALQALAASGARRMRDLPPDARAALMGALGLAALAQQSDPPTKPACGLTDLGGGRMALLVDVPFGRCGADALDRLADQADAFSSDIHVSPTRGFALVTTHIAAAQGADKELSRHGFLTRADDPRGAVAACPGAPACASGSTATLIDAGRLAEAFRPFAARGLRAHVSGCAKGCAHPAAIDLTLVGDHGLYGVVLAGPPGALPPMTLTFEAALDRLRRADPSQTLAQAFRIQP